MNEHDNDTKGIRINLQRNVLKLQDGEEQDITVRLRNTSVQENYLARNQKENCWNKVIGKLSAMDLHKAETMLERSDA